MLAGAEAAVESVNASFVRDNYAVEVEPIEWTVRCEQWKSAGTS